MTDVTLNGLRFLAQRAELERRDDGAMILRSPVPLGDYPATLGGVLVAQARANGERTFLAGRDGDGWQSGLINSTRGLIFPKAANDAGDMASWRTAIDEAITANRAALAAV